MENHKCCVPAEKNKSDGNLLKVAGIIGLVMASPFIAGIAFFVVICIVAIVSIVFGSLHDFAPWLALSLGICMLPMIKDKMQGKKSVQQLENRIHELEHDLLDARKQILELEEGADFHRKLAESNKEHANRDFPVNVNISMTKTSQR